MIAGFDFRPALFAGAGIGRYAQELAAALTHLPDAPFLELYASAWRRPSAPGAASLEALAPGRFRIHRGWLPARALAAAHRLPGLDAGRVPARVDVFHWTDFVYPRVRSAAAVLTLHDAAFARDPAFHGPNTPVLAARVRRALRRAHLVLVVSEPGRADAELLGVPPDRVRVVPNGVSPFFRPAPEPMPPPRPFVLSVGTLEPRKNYPRLLQALEILWDRGLDAEWILVGRVGWECAAFLDRMERSRHRRRIHWIQHATDEELRRFYREAEALLYPSLHEGFGLPVLEAMACAAPVLVAAGGAPAWVAGAGAVTACATDVDSLAEGVAAVLRSDARGRVAALRQRAAEFRWERSARLTLRAYQEAVALAAAP